MANWALNCKACGRSFTFADIEDTLENYFLPAKPLFPRFVARMPSLRFQVDVYAS
jgi:hypothetical protein